MSLSVRGLDIPMSSCAQTVKKKKNQRLNRRKTTQPQIERSENLLEREQSRDIKLAISTQESLSTNGSSNGCLVREELREKGLLSVAGCHVGWEAKPGETYDAQDNVQKETKSKTKEISFEIQQEEEEGKEVCVPNMIHTFEEDNCAPSTVVTLLKACAERHDLQQGIQIHTSIAKRDALKKNVFVGSALVSMYAKCGSLVKAQEAFDGLSRQNVVSWNALISGYVQHKHIKEALTCFKRMQAEGIMPDNVTFSCILKACGSTGALEKGQEVHAQIVEEGLLEQYPVVGNALVDMYVKCGMVEEAEDVFAELPTRDVVTWTSLITGYVLQGHGEEALRCYEKMKQTSCPPNAATFLGILKACSSIQAVREGLEVHAEIVRDGILEKDMVVGTAMVDMYCKCSMMAEAQDVFDELPVQDLLLWSTLIEGYAQNMQGQKALNCFEQMQLAGFRPDEVTFACVLKACGILGLMDKGQELHNRIGRDKLVSRDPVVSNALINMYTKCGLYERAQEVFNEMPRPDVVSWNTLISGYASHGHSRKAITCFEQMIDEGLCPDEVTFTSVLKACGSTGALEKGREVHALTVREGYLDKGVIANTLVYMYVKCGLLEKAKDVFNQLPVRDSVSWNSLIAGHAQDVHGEEAINIFQQMQVEGFSADDITFACVLKACASTGAAEKGQEIHDQILRGGLSEKSLLVSNSLIDMYAKCGLLNKAQEVFDKLPVKDIVSWNALIAGYCQHGLGEQALDHFEQMQLAGQPADSITYVCILKACSSLGAADKGQEVHAQIVKAKLLEKNVLVGTALVDMYAKCGMLEKAYEVFDELLHRDVVLWNALITGYVQHALHDEALDCFQQMQFECITPDVVSFVCMLKACGSLGAVHKGHEMHAEITKRGWLEKDSTVVSALVDMYANCGLAMEAREIFDKLSITDIVSWNSLIAGYALLGQDKSTFSVLHDMVQKGYKPDSVTFTTVVNTCSHGGHLDKGQIFFELMVIDFGINPTLKHFTCIVDMFARAGQLDKAAAVILRVPSHVDVAIWHALLGAYHSLRDSKLAKWAFKHAAQLEYKESSTYISFSNMYAADHMLEDQSKMQPGMFVS